MPARGARRSYPGRWAFISRAVLLRPAVRRGARCQAFISRAVGVHGRCYGARCQAFMCCCGARCQARMCRRVVYAGRRLCAGKRLRCEGLGKAVAASGCQATGAERLPEAGDRESVTVGRVIRIRTLEADVMYRVSRTCALKSWHES